MIQLTVAHVHGQIVYVFNNFDKEYLTWISKY